MRKFDSKTKERVGKKGAVLAPLPLIEQPTQPKQQSKLISNSTEPTKQINLQVDQ